MCSINEIKEFRGEYAFLSNFHPCKILYKGLLYQSVEAAFQAQKSRDHKVQQIFTRFTDPVKAKQRGAMVMIRSDWDEIKDQVMYELLIIKFQDPVLRKRLLQTENAILIHKNDHMDRYWGVYGYGENRLGIMLMNIRESIRCENGSQ